MDFLQELGSHRGGLIRLKVELFWYGGRGRDGVRGRVCLLMDSAPRADTFGVVDAFSDARDWSASPGSLPAPGSLPGALSNATALLLLDGAPHWVWVAQADVELLS